MMIITAKLNRTKLLMAAGILIAAVAAIALAAGGAARSAAVIQPKNGDGDADRVAYLEDLGWEVDPTPQRTEEILIPDPLDEDVYGDYLAIQREVGFDLTEYAGKTVTRYTYRVLNYPTGEDDVVAGLLVYRGRIIGGDIMSCQLDGFIHSLLYPGGASAEPSMSPSSQ